MKRVGQPIKERKEREVVGYKCRFCGEENDLIQLFAETAYGHGHVVNIDGEVEERETDDYGNFEITGYQCNHCDREGNSVEDMVEPVFEGGENGNEES